MKMKSLVAVLALVATGMAQATTKPVKPVPVITWEVANPSAVKIGGKTISYTPLASQVYVYNGNITQSPKNIESVIEDLFKLPNTGVKSISLVDSDDSLFSATRGSFTVDHAFDYLAVHIGQGELIFHWNTEQAAGTKFTFSNLPHGVSNFRAYDAVNAVTAPVPEPETYAMMLGGLALMGVVARRKAAK